MMDFTMTSEQVAYLVGGSITAALLAPAILQLMANNKKLRKANRLLANQSDADKERLNLLMSNSDPSSVRTTVMSSRWKSISECEQINEKAINDGRNI